MIRVLFICHGNICRSPMAEFVLRDMVRKQGLGQQFHIESAATSAEEIGNPVHCGTRKKLASVGISTDGKRAVRLQKSDYEKYDFLIGMEGINVRNMICMLGGDPEKKIYRLLDFSDSPRNIADPWYTGNFDETYKDVVEGCEAFLEYLKKQHRI